jgi:hypothetical protein
MKRMLFWLACCLVVFTGLSKGFAQLFTVISGEITDTVIYKEDSLKSGPFKFKLMNKSGDELSIAVAILPNPVTTTTNIDSLITINVEKIQITIRDAAGATYQPGTKPTIPPYTAKQFTVVFESKDSEIKKEGFSGDLIITGTSNDPLKKQLTSTPVKITVYSRFTQFLGSAVIAPLILAIAATLLLFVSVLLETKVFFPNMADALADKTHEWAGATQKWRAGSAQDIK